MLSQTTGVIGKLKSLGRCPDNSTQYRIYSPKANQRFYGTLVIECENDYLLFGYSSCHRFSGYFEISFKNSIHHITACINGERSQPLDWVNNELESVVILKGDNLQNLYQEYADYISHNHPATNKLLLNSPNGWCSWYAYYHELHERNILDNIDMIERTYTDIEYVMIDDGYQSHMGDWLTRSPNFKYGVEKLIHSIRARHKKPAIWLAPFIASESSEIFRQHPDWFIKNIKGKPLRAADVTYGGWRDTPWFILDMTHPQAVEYIRHVVKTFRNWGVELFKLDACYWGAMQGVRYEHGVTSIEAYRRGLEIIREEAGDAWIMACNAPMWPSLGLVDIMRVSDDVERDGHRFEQIHKESAYRSWQHRKLWHIDPDCICLTSLANQTTEKENYDFHRDSLLAMSGVYMSGDPLPELTPFAKDSLEKLFKRHKMTQESAQFSSLSLNQARLSLTPHATLHSMFNYGQEEKSFTLISGKPADWYDYWSGQKLNAEPSTIYIQRLHSAMTSRSIICKEIDNV
jgi:alpha-galactosidase